MKISFIPNIAVYKIIYYEYIILYIKFNKLNGRKWGIWMYSQKN